MATNELKVRQALPEEMKGLVEEAERHLPNSILVCGFLKGGFIRGSFDENQTKVFIPNQSLPFFVVITGIIEKNKRQSLSVFWDINSIGKKTINQLLLSIPHFQWTEIFLLYATYKPFIREITDFLLTDGGPGVGIMQESLENICNLYIYENIALNESIGKRDVEVRSIPMSLVPKVHHCWHYNTSRSLKDMQRLVKRLPSSALYVTPIGYSASDAGASEMEAVSWVMTKDGGEIGMTYTIPEYRNQGYASIVTLDLVAKLQEYGLTPYLLVDLDNGPSNEFHAKIGFERKDCLFAWKFYVRAGENFMDF